MDGEDKATMCANPALKSRITLNKFGLGPKDEHCVIISGDDNLGDGVSKCGADAKKPIAAGHKPSLIKRRNKFANLDKPMNCPTCFAWNRGGLGIVWKQDESQIRILEWLRLVVK